MRLPQKDIKWLGKLIESLYISLPILSIINFLSILMVLYTSTKPYILEYIPWVTFWMFGLVIAGTTCCMVLLAWMFIVPSVWALRGKQMFGWETRREVRMEVKRETGREVRRDRGDTKLKKILVTGGCGFLGSHVCELFQGKGWEVIPYDNLTKFEYSRTPYNVEAIRNYNLKYLEQLGISTIVADVRDFEELKKAVTGCDLIAHCAAQPAMTIAYEEPYLDFDVNARGFMNILEVARAESIPVANCSTIHIYGNGINEELRESTSRFENIWGPIHEGRRVLSGSLSPLHASKRTTEIYGLAYTDSFALPVASFRLTGIYGPRQFGGEDHGWVANFAIKAVLGKMVKIYGTDKQVRDILYVKDAAQAFMDWYNAGCPPGIYNIGGGEKSAISLQECLKLLGDITGKSIQIAMEGERKGDLYWYVSDYGKATRSFGWKPETLPPSGVLRLVDWIKENKEIFK